MDDDSSTKFIGSLTKFLQSLCNGYVEFQRGVELCGHIYLSIDTGEKVDYILHEKVSKNDENSVTFVSNSFHAQPLNKEKEKEKSADKDASSKSAPSSRVSKDISGDDDDDIMIVDQPKDVPGSTNSGTIPSKGVKRAGSPSSDHRQPQRIRSAAGSSLPRSQGSNSNTVVSPPRSVGSRPQPGGPSATVTSQDAAQDNLNMVDLKLEQITRDELLSLASQVGEGGSGPSHPTSSAPRPHPQPQRSGATASVNNTGDAALWIKQEVPEDNGTGDSDEVWSHGREDSNSNSGSNLYPVMLHQNPAAFSNPVFPGFSGSTTSGASSAANPYTNPLPGTSQDMSGLDPSAHQYPNPSKLSPPNDSNRMSKQHVKLDGISHLPEWTQRNRCKRKVYKTEPFDIYDSTSTPLARGIATIRQDHSRIGTRSPSPTEVAALADRIHFEEDLPASILDLSQHRGKRGSGLQPSKNKSTLKSRRRRERLKQNPHLYEEYRAKQREYCKKYNEKKRRQYQQFLTGESSNSAGCE